jgi:Carboxypeptidase regulatory-like domain
MKPAFRLDRSTSMVVAVAFALTLVSACSAPTTPTPPTPPTPSPFPSTTRQLSGVVRDEGGLPIAGAKVTVFTPNVGTPEASVITDATGSYQISATVLGPPFHFYGTEVTITTADHDTHLFVSGSTDTMQDFVVFPVVDIAAGDQTRLALRPENSLCGFELEFLCRTIRVTTASRGMVTIDTVSDSGMLVFLQLGGPFDTQYPFHGETHVSFPTTAQSSVIVQLLHGAVSAQWVTVKTSLAAQ